MATLYDCVWMTTATTGTGTITLGSALAGYQSAASAGVPTGTVVSYRIVDGNNFEYGHGTYTTSGTTLSRTVIGGSSGASAISLSGTATVMLTALAEDITAIVSLNASVVGSARNAKMSVTSASATATFTAAEIIVKTALGGLMQVRSSYSQSINLGTTGAGGMDTGAAPVSGFVSIYAIAKPDGTTSILACAVATSTASIYGGANIPSGYTYSALIGVWPTDSSKRFVVGIQNGDMFSGAENVVLSGGVQTSYTSVSISGAVPPNATCIVGYAAASYSSAGGYGSIAADSSGTGAFDTGTVASGIAMRDVLILPIITTQTVYYKTSNSGTGISLVVTGYKFQE